MPSTTSETPSVSLSFANNFWGKDDAGVSPLLERMHNAKVTGDELKSFYTARAAIEDEYARKLLNLARKPLGSSESGTLRMSLDVVRGEVESMGKSHQNVAAQMKSELDEQLSAFAGGMKERRKIVQGGTEKLLKVKTQQTGVVNKARDRYEQDCLKIKGYLAQGHMVMGQEERKNKAKLEKTQIQLSTTRNEYEAAVKTVEETTGKWNREWKSACDKFQDLEEERIDFMKSSLWSFANIASTVCVSDDASCEKIRLSLEECDVEKDISSFIKDSGTGQEIPDAPKFIDFCRGDISDVASEASNDDNYQVAQFQRTINPAFRSSSPQPSLGSHKDAQEDFRASIGSNGRGQKHITIEETPKNADQVGYRPNLEREDPYRPHHQRADPFQNINREEIPEVPHNEYPPDGMTQFCRMDPSSQNSSNVGSSRPISRDSHSDYSNPTDLSSQVPSLGAPSPTKQMGYHMDDDLDIAEAEKKRSGFFAPFRRKSKTEKDSNNRNTWGPSTSRSAMELRSQRQLREESPEEPLDPNTQYQLSIGNNVFDVANPSHRQPQHSATSSLDDIDPIAKALGDLKRLSKDSSARMSADRYHGLATPAPGAASTGSSQSTPRAAVHNQMPDRTRDAPPPSYNQAPSSRLGAPQPAFTSRQMQQTTQKYVDQKQSMFGAGSNSSPPNYNTYDNRQRPGANQASRGAPPSQSHPSRATSPSPYRPTSPRPAPYNDHSHPPPQGNLPRAASPNPYLNGNATAGSRPRAQSASPTKPVSTNYPAYPGTSSSPVSRGTAPAPSYARSASPNPMHQQQSQQSRFADPRSQDTSMQLAHPGPAYSNPRDYPTHHQQQQPQMRPRTGTNAATARPLSQHNMPPGNNGANRARSKSTAAPGPRPTSGQFTRDGRPILHYSRALYLYTAAIPEELSFSKGDILGVTRLQDDGWWEATIVEKAPGPAGRGGAPVGRGGLVPSNYLAAC